MHYGTITDVPGIKAGNKENQNALTGCTVVLAENGACGGVEVRGSAPGTKETDLLDPVNLVDQVHAVCLVGGSAFGLEATSGVMNYLEENSFGLDVGVAKVPIVPGAALFDLAVGDGNVRPDKQMGYQAAKLASTEKVSEGNVGAGCGATVGKVMGLEHAMKGGLGSASLDLGNGVTIGAIAAVNAFGDVRDPVTGEILAGPFHQGKITDSLDYLLTNPALSLIPGSNTTIGVVAVNAKLTKAEATKIAQMAHNGFARTIFPAHSMQDGDTIFVLGTGNKRLPIDLLGSMAANVMEEAVIRAIKNAKGVLEVPAYHDIR